jgi:hypothetical protein
VFHGVKNSAMQAERLFLFKVDRPDGRRSGDRQSQTVLAVQRRNSLLRQSLVLGVVPHAQSPLRRRPAMENHGGAKFPQILQRTLRSLKKAMAAF